MTPQRVRIWKQLRAATLVIEGRRDTSIMFHSQREMKG